MVSNNLRLIVLKKKTIAAPKTVQPHVKSPAKKAKRTGFKDNTLFIMVFQTLSSLIDDKKDWYYWKLLKLQCPNDCQTSTGVKALLFF